ncbi:MAG: NAD(P)/FAD-dependent oxidoreductase [Pseudomonadales bacterium]|jgi:predicted Rossmann fold flavoprotein|nr:NAD(P)/FAD-dependent oxidoreductase [Pseudomonadales bacterium]
MRGRDHFDVVVIGAGAAGLFCAITAGRRGRRVLVLDHADRIGKKILMSGGGRCNFTHLHSTPEHFLSANPHFCKSALSRYTPWDFLALVDGHGIPHHEKTPGQLFCDRSSKDIVAMLQAECDAAGVEIRTRQPVRIRALAASAAEGEDGPAASERGVHELETPGGPVGCDALVVATGGYSIPTLGATGFAFDLARSLGLAIRPTRAALVPFTLTPEQLAQLEDLSGVSVDAEVRSEGPAFREPLLFTHRGLSGPGMLQASTYWTPGHTVAVDLFPGIDLAAHLREARTRRPRQSVRTVLAEQLPKRVVQRWCEHFVRDQSLAELSDAAIDEIVASCQPWRVLPAGTEGWRTAEVTLGGIDTGALSSKTMECRAHPGLYFVGEAIDVTGQLGGHNFQWAWASGHAAGTAA